MITYIIIGITVFVSYMAFNDSRLFDKLQFNAAKVIHQKEYYRLITHAFVHANWSHLIVNMLVLFFFGRVVEYYFKSEFEQRSTFYMILLYFGGILASNIWSLLTQKNNYYYNAVGASGAVSAMLFASIFFSPLELVYLFMILPIPGIVFGVAYLFYSYQMSKKKTDNVAHDAHFLGAVFGFVFPILLRPALFDRFIDQLFSFL